MSFLASKSIEKKPADAEAQVQTEEPVVKKQGFFARLFGSSEEEIVDTGIKDDLKSIAKITLNVMKRLAPEDVDAFKASSEYSQFKDVLQKHGLIKPPQ